MEGGGGEGTVGLSGLQGLEGFGGWCSMEWGFRWLGWHYGLEQYDIEISKFPLPTSLGVSEVSE